MRYLIVCCDGTWDRPDRREGGVLVPTNVVQIYNACSQSNEKAPQLKYYHPGVGTGNGWLKHLNGGLTGAGLNRNIMSAYQWLCRKYVAGDLICLFGFSRGAYTVRSLAGFMIDVGLLSVTGLSDDDMWARIGHLFRYGYRDQKETRDDWLTNGWSFHSCNGRHDIPIHLIGVWDTVGALGIPESLGVLSLLDSRANHMFHHTELSPLVHHARHAVSIDEMRASFQPTLWTEPNGCELKQVWFPGVHGDVGGGYRECGLSDRALKWMLDEASGLGLAFEPNMVAQLRPDARGVLHDSMSDAFKLMPSRPRSVPRLDHPDTPMAFDIDTSVDQRRESPPIRNAPYRPTLKVLDEDEDSCEIPVYAMHPWNATGLWLERGVSYRFTSSGQWLDGTVACGPGGTRDGHFQTGELGNLVGSGVGQLETGFRKLSGNRRANFEFAKRHERLGGRRIPWFCLLGAIANGGLADENGRSTLHETFMIGEAREYKPRRSGYLYAYANDAWNFYGNNHGSVTLKIVRRI